MKTGTEVKDPRGLAWHARVAACIVAALAMTVAVMARAVLDQAGFGPRPSRIHPGEPRVYRPADEWGGPR